MSNLTAAEIAEIMAMATAALPTPVTVTVNRRRYTLDGHTVQHIRTERQSAGSARRSGTGNSRHVAILGDLNAWVAEKLSVDNATAHQILRKIR